MSSEDEGSPVDSDPLERSLRDAAERLPAQGPISVFIHHNPLHAYEDRRFEEAVVAAGRRLGCEPFAPEAFYRAELARGRIRERDVEAALRSELGARAGDRIAGVVTRIDLWRRVVMASIPEARGVPLRWLLGETDALARFRRDLPEEIRERALSTRRVWGLPDPESDEAFAVAGLWRAALSAVRRAPLTLPDWYPEHVRHRDALLAARGVDTDAWIQPMFIRFVSAYLDQGLAHWTMPERERGLHAAFLSLYDSRWIAVAAPWTAGLRRLVAEDRRQRRDGRASLRHSLAALGVGVAEWPAFLSHTALSLRGWAGMVHQIETRPDRVPAHALPATLADYLAVQLLVERAALSHAVAVHGLPPLGELRATLRRELKPAPPPSDEERAWVLFHAAQLDGIDESALDAMTAEDIDDLEAELGELGELTRRRILHLAYEKHLRDRFYGLLVAHAPPPPFTPRFQAIFCLDEREESLRRHLEEVAPDVETFGAAGFFGVAMYYQGASDAHPRPLCPVAIRPDTFVAEVALDERRTRLWRWQRRGLARLSKNLHVGSRTLFRGSLVMLLGAVSILPMVLRVLFPWLHQRFRPLPAPRTALSLERTPDAPPLGRHSGFTVEQMAAMVEALLRSIGLPSPSPLVLVIGHGSSSLNNPHESAHDCGACGGGHGGPNARSWAQMANDPRVRVRLAERGLVLDGSWFVAGERNTASSRIDFFDVHAIPDSHREAFRRARRDIQEAREREAHERCRRFETAPARWSPRTALRHVEARSADLAQPRPEYGHATNAFCIVGRRRRSRGLFLDRRAFLVSYDPDGDADGAILARMLAAVVPVVTGINLEYYFGFVDPSGYGSGTKLPHNVASLLGVMDGAQSDLRTGLPWQMLEIHEPVRLSLVVEAPRARLESILTSDPSLRRLVDNAWMYLACLEPEGHALWRYQGGAFAPFEAEPAPRHAGDSRSYYRGHRGHLPFARLEAR